ncbi:PREDICTED: G-type lectin S-receptor-like serine/threonine-protein kinase At4g27290 isoform X2 [Ipomoea nil]|uniref:G-type lectin S-receptor-like serine/threonine-protein kinase At4g27290 isoform X2 n=1 Tax=Ipomoea nil TaxID=35883 RepID=UPI000900A585|nr:PREDICTED: G-type lectin S-receptor-like serine/threonine-protein kinase At4g27290 isoform X2 [Ipomoea nil]
MQWRAGDPSRLRRSDFDRKMSKERAYSEPIPCDKCLDKEVSFARDTISLTQFLKDGDTIVSSGGIFEMGFFSPTNSQNCYVGIWYKQIPVSTIVWVANRDTPLTNTSSVVLKIINPGWLALVDGDNNNASIWHTNTSRLVSNPVAKLLDSGNLVVTDANDDSPENLVWQSFDHPTDTQLPGMKRGKNFITGLEIVLSAWKAENNPQRGEYELSIDPTGYPQSIMRKGGKKVYRAGSWNGVRWGGTRGIEKKSYVIDTSVIINTNEVSTSFKVHNSSGLVRMVLTSSGSILLYEWADETDEWKILRNAPTDVCDTYGSCGAYGSCNYDNFPICGCLDKFLPRDPVAWGKGDYSGGCVRWTPLNCQNVTSNSNGFLKYSDIKLPDTEFTRFNTSMNLEECEQVCLKNCSCMAYSSLDISNGQNGCLLWFRDLIDIRVLPALQGQDLYIRMASSDLDYPSSSKGKKSKSKKSKIIKLTSSVLVGILVLSMTLIVVIILYKRKKKEINLKLKWEEDQILFEVSTITRATNNFSLNNKIGEGGYGHVYKGVLDDKKEVAVKRLSKTSKQGLGEFKNEVNSIARLQHRNLVKLLGWCIQGDEKMLIYEYMSNKSLDSYIFDIKKRALLDWPKRFNIINGIARGLLYLHQDSRLKIIHRDLKASNILLDIDMNPKISDFGLARSIGLNETGANTNRVAGTLGYMSPEYAGHGVFSIKSDVFSFGVLVLEIVSGKRNREFSHHQDHYENLLAHAWKLYRDGRLIELVDEHLDAPCDLPQVLRSIHVSLLCVQHYPEDRPSTSSIVHMLANNVELPIAKEPGFFTKTRLNETKSSLGDEISCSINEVTISSFGPR